MMRRTRWISLLLLVMMLLSPLAAWAEPEEPAPTEPLRYEPNLRLSTRYRIPTLEAGKETRLVIPLDNTGLGTARNVYVTLQVNGPDTLPIELDRTILRRNVSSINGSDRGDVPFYLTIRTNAPSGLYTLPFTVEYTGSDQTARYTFADNVYVRVENNLEPARLVIDEVEVAGNRLQAGTTAVVRVWVKNAGDLALSRIQASLEGFGSNGLYLNTTQRTRQLEDLDAGERTFVDVPVRVESGIEEGTVPFQLKLSFADGYGKTYETTESIYVPVSGSGLATGMVAIENLQIPSGSLQPFTDFQVTLQVRNISGGKVEDLLVKAEGGDALLPKSAAVQQISSMEPGEVKTIQFTFFARDGIESKNYPLEIRVEPLRSGNSRDAVIQYAGVMVGSGDSSGVPKIIIDQYRIPTDYVAAGSSFPLTISFFNTHAAQSVRNIRISLTSEGDVFSPVGSSNTFFIQRIAPGSRAEREISLRPRPDAGYKIHNVYAEIEYEDEQGNAHQTRELIGIPVIQEARLVFGEVETGMEAFVGNPLPVSLEFYNAGRGKIRNLVVNIEGDFDTSDGALYIGNMDAGGSNYYDATLIPRQPGPMSGKIIFRYDDEIDEAHVMEKAFELQVMEMMGPPDDFWMEEPPMPPSRNRLPYMIGGGVLVLVVAGVILYRRRKKKLGEVDEDE